MPRHDRTWHYLARILMVTALSGVDDLGAQARSNYEELQTFSSVLNHVRLNYVDSISYGPLVRAAVDGVLRALDPHSRLESQEEVERAAAVASGDLATVGIALDEVEGALTVITVLPDGPADRKGVSPGDRLLAMDDSAVAGLDAELLMFRLAGSPGSRVHLSLERGPRLDPRRYEVTLRRVAVRETSVGGFAMLDDVTGYVRLWQFGPEAATEVEAAVNRLRRAGARRLILDVRGNPGGRVTASVDVASLFLPRAAVVFRTRGRRASVAEDYVTQSDGRFKDLPLALLVDELSASASEALAGSLQDHDRALLLGRRSFGKALLQSPFVLPGGDVLWLTTARVLTPSGRFIQRHYAGLAVEQYYGLAGQGGAERDTAEAFRTDAGRVVRGGGGIRPDVEVPPQVPRPAWHPVAADSGFEEAVADSVAYTLPQSTAGRTAWISAPERWRVEVLPPFVARIRERLGVAPWSDPDLDSQLARRLAARVALVRWGVEARDELMLATDPAVAAAREAFSRLPDLLASPTK